MTETSSERDRVLIHLNGVTDAHRADIRPAVLDVVPNSPVRVIDYLLPDDLIASYRFVSLPVADLPDDAGATRDGWLRVHEAGLPDARNPRRLPNPLGRWSSVLMMPGAGEHPVWDAAAPAVRRVEQTALPLGGAFVGRTATLLGDPTASPAERPRLLVLLDGENWERVGIRDALARSTAAAAASGNSVVLVPSGTLEERSAVLPHPERVATLLEEVLAARAACTGVGADAARTIVAGQSYGGLAAAALVSLRPDLVTTAVVQSGSFHFRADEEPRPPGGESGDLIERVRLNGTGSLEGRRLFIQSGTEETGMTASADRFAEAARAAGASTRSRVYSGGHDYAWWRTGLFDALDELDALEAPDATNRRRRHGR